MLVVLVAVAAGVALTQRRLAASETGDVGGVAFGRGQRRLIAAGFVALALAAFAVAALVDERRRAPAGATAARLTSIESNRYEYWPIALRAFGDDPLKGLGSGGYQVAWLRERPIPEGAYDAHSLYLETGAELGLVGLLALGLFLGGIGWGAMRAQARDPVAAAGLIAAGAVFLVHAGLDWLWEMPAVSLPALLLAAGLVRLDEGPDLSQDRTHARSTHA
jgi:O-antigen ligase